MFVPLVFEIKYIQSNETNIILLDEVDLKNVTLNDESTALDEGNNLELDLSYLSEYENIHFIICLRPAMHFGHFAIEGFNNFTISFPTLQPNQHFSW